MALTQVTGPYPIFTDLDGSPLDDGYLYIGEVNEDPETNPIQAYWDSNLTIPASQPIRTNSGYAWRNGTPGLIYTAGEFSITIRNKRNEFVLYSPVGYGFDPGAVSASVVKNDFVGDGVTVDFTLSASPSTKLATNVFINGVYQEKDSYSLLGNVITFSVAPPLSSSIEVMTNETGVINTGNATAITYTASFPGAVQQTVQTKLEQYVSVKDFGAVGDGVTDDTAAIEMAFDYCDPLGLMLYFPDGIYRITSPINLPRGGIRGDSVYSTQILVDIAGATSSTNALTYGISGDYNAARSGIESLWIKIADYSEPTTMLYLDTPNHTSFMRDVKIETGEGCCVKAKEFFTFYFDNVTFIGRYTATPGPLNTLEGIGFSTVATQEINNVLFNKCTFTFLRQALESNTGQYRGSNAIKFNQCLFESLGETVGNVDGFQANFDCCYFEALNLNENGSLTYSVMQGGVNNIVFDQSLFNCTTVSTTLPLFDMQIGSVIFNDNTSLDLPVGFTGTVVDRKTYGTRGQLIVNWGAYPVVNSFLALPSQWCGGYGENERPASPSYKAYNVSRFEYEFTGLTSAGAYQINEFLEGFLQLKNGTAYFVNIEAEINYRNETTGQISYLKSNQSWYISGSATGASIAPDAVDNSQISDAGGFLTGAWLANNTLRYLATGTGYRRFALYRETKTGTAYPANVVTKYKVRVSPTTTTLDDSIVGIVDYGNV